MARQKLSEYQKELRKEKRKEDKINRENKLITQHLDLIKVMYLIFGGQILNQDLRDFCLRYKIYKSENEYNIAIDTLVKNKILKKDVLLNTAFVVLIAKSCVCRYFGNKKSIEYSQIKIRENCYKYIIIKNIIKKQNVLESYTLDDVIKVLEQSSTVLVKKNNAKASYDFFTKYLTLDEEVGKSIRDNALYKQYSHISQLPNVTVTEVEKPIEILNYRTSLGTIRDIGIYTKYHNNKLTFYIADIQDNFICSTVAKKIATVLNTLKEQIDKVEHLNKLDSINIIILMRNKNNAIKLNQGFRLNYIDKNGAKAKKHIFVDSLNRAIKKQNYNFKLKYKDKELEPQDFIYNLDNTFIAEGFNLKIQIADCNLDEKITMYKRTETLVKARIEQKEKQLKEKLRKEIEEELRAKIIKEYEINIVDDI